MNSSSNPAPEPLFSAAIARLGQVIDNACWVVSDAWGAPGRRILSLHTTEDAASAMASHLNQDITEGPVVQVCSRSVLSSPLVGELDQLTMALKNDPGLLRVAIDGKLSEIDTFSLIDPNKNPPHHSSSEPDSPPFDFAKVLPAIFQHFRGEAQSSSARRLAERLFEAMCLEEGGDTYRGEEMIQHMADVCCQRALAFTRAADKAFKPDPHSGDSHAR